MKAIQQMTGKRRKMCIRYMYFTAHADALCLGCFALELVRLTLRERFLKASSQLSC